MDFVKAVVQKVFSEGDHGPFAVATSEDLESSITFSLEPTIWKEDEWPEVGMFVHLSQLRQKRAGWRAKAGRFWKPSDEQTERSKKMKGEPQFLYPKSRRYPFDELCERIVRALEERDWKVPGFEVRFDVYGTGEAKYRLVREIKGHDFRLHFGRIQGRLGSGRWNDTAAITTINIPRMELHVYNDESGPSFYVYVGDDWERDHEKFMRSSKVNSKLNKEPRTYLRYTGGCDCQSTAGTSFKATEFLTATPTGDRKALIKMRHTHPGQRSPILIHNNDLGREYEPDGDEPHYYLTSEIFLQFTNWLTEHILDQITIHPLSTKEIDNFPPEEAIPFPESIGGLFTFGEWRDAERIEKGKEDPSQLDPSDHYGLIGNGYRFISLDVPNDDTMPKIVYDGFNWCGIGEVTPETPFKELEIPGHHWSDREQFIIRLVPNRANDIFVADISVREVYKATIFAEDPKKERLTNEEYCEFLRSTGRTIVPISEYDGSFKQPVVLVHRELSFDEVEIVSGPHKDRN